MRTLWAGLAIGLAVGWWLARATVPDAPAPAPDAAPGSEARQPELAGREPHEGPTAPPPAMPPEAPARADVLSRLRDGSFAEARAAALQHTAWTEDQVDALIARVEEARRMRHRAWFEGLLGALAATKHPRAIRYVLDADADEDMRVVLTAEKVIADHLMDCEDPQLAEAAAVRADDPRRPGRWHPHTWGYIAGRSCSAEVREQLLAHAPWEARQRLYFGWMAAEPPAAPGILRRALADPEVGRAAYGLVSVFVARAGPAAVPVLEDALRELEGGRPTALGLPPLNLLQFYLVPTADIPLEHRLRFVLGLQREDVRLLAAFRLPNLLGGTREPALVQELAREPARLLRRLARDGVRSGVDRDLLKLATESLEYERPPLLDEENLAALEAALPLMDADTDAVRERLRRCRALLDDPDAWR